MAHDWILSAGPDTIALTIALLSFPITPAAGSRGLPVTP
jgi:hypothetical protein